jgi:SAM-dependent methyltransferase
MLKRPLKWFVQKLLPVSVRRNIIRYTRLPPVGWVRFGNLRSSRPISPDWGMERGQPIDRYYIERFLLKPASDIQGRVLEIGDNTYTCKFGEERVTESVVLHVAEKKEHVTLIGSLTDTNVFPACSFDCFIVTQTLQTIFDVPFAIRTIHHSLKPGGVALITVPGISKVSRYDMERWRYYWSFTTGSIEKLLSELFPRDHLQIEVYGNVLTSIAFLHGLATQELSKKELDYCDPDYQLLITVRAVRPLSEIIK